LVNSPERKFFSARCLYSWPASLSQLRRRLRALQVAVRVPVATRAAGGTMAVAVVVAAVALVEVASVVEAVL
jgi:hypothetical protein